MGEDFDDFLRKVTESEARRAEDERYIHNLRRRFMDEIRRRELPRVIDDDPETQIELQDRALRDFATNLDNGALELPEQYAEDPEMRAELIRLRAGTEVKKLALEQTALLARMLKLATAHETQVEHGQPLDPELVTSAKKQLTAELIVLWRYEPDDPWITFLNDMVPGASLNTSNPADEHYLISAYEKLANEEIKQQRIAEINEECYRVAGVNREDPTNSDIELVRAVGQMLIVGGSPGSGENAAAERQSRLNEIARAEGLDPQTTQRVIAFIEEKFPI